VFVEVNTMTTITMDPAKEDALSGTTPPALPTATPGQPLPAQLLTRVGDSPHGNVSRLALGFAGLSALALLPDSARLWVSPGRHELGVADFGLVLALDAISLPIAAVLTLTFALPGLLILLGVFDQPLAPTELFQTVSRAYYRVGLLALGATPTLLLFALTGASHGLVSVGVSLVYLGAGVLSLSVLLHDVLGSLSRRKGLAPLVVLGWAGFVALFGLHLFTRLNVEPWL
jgi:hypothetical protein